MKKKRIKIHSRLESCQTVIGDCGFDECNLFFKSSHLISGSMNPEITIEVNVPETIKEFCNIYDISKKTLLEWLIENYKL